MQASLRLPLSTLLATSIVLSACTASTLPPISTVAMTVSSTDFVNNGSIPAAYTCDGANERPALQIENVPEETKSLAIVLFDPDAPNGGFLHWLVWNIDPTLTNIDTDNPLTDAIQGLNGGGRIGYTGPCPPSGTHHYNFTVYASSVMLPLSSSATLNEVQAALADNTLAQATFTGVYARTTPSSSTSSSSPSQSSSSGSLNTEPGAVIPPPSKY